MNRVIVRFAVLALFLTAVPVTAQGGWSSIASAGVITGQDLGLYTADFASIGLKPGSTGHFIARYNVSKFGAVFTDTPSWTTLEMTYFDNSPFSDVSAHLFQVDRCTGASVFICKFLSIDSPVPRCHSCTFPAGTINFTTHEYFVEIVVNRSISNPDPRAFAVRIF